MTTDPFEGMAFEPATLHRYLYAANNPVMFVDPSGEMFGLCQVMHTVSIMINIANAFHIGYQVGTLIDRAIRSENLMSWRTLQTLGQIALSVIPAKYLVKVAHLSKVAAMFERLGFASKILDTSPKVKGFNKVFHWVQRLYERGFTPQDALEALTDGVTWVDSKSGAIAKVLGNGRLDGTIKVIIDKGKIVYTQRSWDINGFKNNFVEIKS